MARFDVYRHPDAALRKATPFLLSRDLNPGFEVDGVAVVLDAAAIGAIAVSELKAPVANLRAQGHLIVNALDALFGPY